MHRAPVLNPSYQRQNGGVDLIMLVTCTTNKREIPMDAAAVELEIQVVFVFCFHRHSIQQTMCSATDLLSLNQFVSMLIRC